MEGLVELAVWRVKVRHFFKAERTACAKALGQKELDLMQEQKRVSVTEAQEGQEWGLTWSWETSRTQFTGTLFFSGWKFNQQWEKNDEVWAEKGIEIGFPCSWIILISMVWRPMDLYYQAYRDTLFLLTEALSFNTSQEACVLPKFSPRNSVVDFLGFSIETIM